MIKVHILDRCRYCNGEAYLPVGEESDSTGGVYIRYRPCPMCEGSGLQERWVSLREFADLLDRAIAMEPDYQELAKQLPTSQYQGSHDAAGI